VTVTSFDPSHRGLLHALTLSLVMHAAVLLGVASDPPSRLDVPATTIRVVFRAAETAPTAAVAIAPDAQSFVLPPSRRRPAAVPRASPSQLVVAKSSSANSPLVAPALPPPAIVATEKTAEAIDDTGRLAGMQTSVSSGAPTLSNKGVNPDELRQYRLALAIAARRFKHYPAMARERGWEGTAEVALSLGGQRPVPEVALARSSGHAVLDRQAQEMIAQAARATVLPESLKGRDLRLSLPVQFSLDGDQ